MITFNIEVHRVSMAKARGEIAHEDGGAQVLHGANSMV